MCSLIRDVGPPGLRVNLPSTHTVYVGEAHNKGPLGRDSLTQVTSATSSLLCFQNYFESYLAIASTVSSVLCLVANFLLVNR